MLMPMELMGALVQGPQLPTLLTGSVLPAKLNCTTTLIKNKIVPSRHICHNRVSIIVKCSQTVRQFMRQPRVFEIFKLADGGIDHTLQNTPQITEYFFT